MSHKWVHLVEGEGEGKSVRPREKSACKSPEAGGSVENPRTGEGHWGCSAGSKGKNGLRRSWEARLGQKPLFQNRRRKTNINREAWGEAFIPQRKACTQEGERA